MMTRCVLFVVPLAAVLLMVGARPATTADLFVIPDEQYTHQVLPMFNPYHDNSDFADRYMEDTKAGMATKLRAWKRNVDLINSILALPKGLNDAGR